MPIDRDPSQGSGRFVLSGETVAQVLFDVGFKGEAIVTALAVAKAESDFDAWALNYAAAGGQWGPTVGLFQVRVLLSPPKIGMDARRSLAKMKNAEDNARFAYDLSQGGRTWKAWSAYTNGSYRRWLDEARAWALTPDGKSPRTPAPKVGSVPLVANDWIDEDRAALPIVMEGGAAPGELGNRVVRSLVSLSMAEASEVTLELEDQHSTLLRKGKVTEGIPMRVASQRLLVTSVGVSQGPGSPHVQVRAQPAGVVRLRGVTPAAVHLSPVKFARNMAKTAGMPFLGGPPAPAVDIAAGDVALAGRPARAALDPTTSLAHGTRKENAWEVMRRLAVESEGYVCFESGGTLHFATQDWLLRNAGTAYVVVGSATLDDPRARRAIRAIGTPTLTRTIKRDGQNQPYRHVEAEILLPPGLGWKVLPGQRMWLAEPSGIVDDARPMLVMTSTYSAGDRTTPVKVTAESYTAPGDIEASPTTVGDRSGYGSIQTSGQITGGGRTGLQAVAFAESQASRHTTGWYRRCDNFVAQCYGHAHSGFETAAIHWAQIPASKKHPGDRTAPIGALLFYSTPNNSSGHVTLFCGSDRLASNDFPIRDQIRISRVGDLEFHWRATYLGWAEPVFR